MSLVSIFDRQTVQAVLYTISNALFLLVISSTTVFAQNAPPVTIYDAFSGYETRIASEAELSDLAYVRADIAARAGNIAVLQEALDRIQTLPGGNVDRILGPSSFAFPDGINSVEERRRFLIEIIMPYLYTDKIGAQFVCGQLPTFTYYTFMQGVSSYESTTDAFGCESGYLMVSSVYRASVISNVEETFSNWVTALQISSPYGRLYYPDGERFRTAPLDNPAHTLLASAAVTGQLDVMSMLLNASADVNIPSDSGYTALHYAVHNDQLASVNRLLQNGAEIGIRTSRGFTPLHIAADGNHVDLMSPLVGAGADVNSRIPGGDTPLVSAINKAHPEAVSELLRLGADLELETSSGLSPLAQAVRISSSSVVQILIDGGADVNKRDAEGRSILHHAVLSRSSDKVGSILVAGGLVNAAMEDGSTPLMLAAGLGRSTIMRMLLSAGADYSIVDANGNSALMRAAITDQSKSVEILIRAGARSDTRNYVGMSAKDIAKARNSIRVRKLFKHIKPIHISYLKIGSNLAKLADDNHASSVGGEFGGGLAIALTRRFRIQADVALLFRNTDVDELALPDLFPSQGDFYYWINSIDVRPALRMALTNPYKSHLYAIAGAGYGSVIVSELRDFTGDLDGEEVTETTSESLTYFTGGLGIQTTLGARTLIMLEFTASTASSFELDLFEGSLSTYSLNLGLGF